MYFAPPDCARNQSPRKRATQDFVGFSDATEMLDSGLLDLVVISTPPNSHFHWAKESLERNINVVLE
ncbi:MAG: Gfo/Idh/MocA family oxidoreductase, partial [Acidimicrobiaceae bacterium]